MKISLPNGRYVTYWSVGILLAFVCLCALAQIETKSSGGGGSSPAIATNALTSIHTNGVLVSTLVTNLNMIYGSGLIWRTTNTDGSVDTRIAADPATIVTNAGGIISTNLGLNTNSGIFSVQYEPNRGSLWYSATNGIPTTNGARAGMEFHPSFHALRVGAVGMNVVENHVYLAASNFWTAPNIGFLSYALGSNNLVNAPLSTVAGGARNLIYTNAGSSYIGGGTNNIIFTNAYESVIGGGGGAAGNSIGVNSFRSVIGGGSDNGVIGGSQHAVIAGGQDNDIQNPNSFATIGGGFDNNIGVAGLASDACIGSTIPGGSGNILRGQYATIGGGRDNNVVGNGSHYATISGGQGNSVGTGPSSPAAWVSIGGGFGNGVADGADYSVIAGGRGNTIFGSSDSNSVISGGAFNSAEINTKFVFISGGERNSVIGNYGSSIGTSNRVSGARATAIGVEVTNTVADTVMLESITRIFTRTNATIGGTIISITTPVASAGAAETNLIAVTIPAHTLTNTGDRVTFRASGRFAATAEAKQLKIVYGSETILDTTSQLVNSGAWTFEGEIIRTGNTSQSVNAEFHGAGESLFTTANSMDLVQTNGIATTLKVTSTAASDGASTNRTMTVFLWPAP